jgi:hypothetical protein
MESELIDENFVPFSQLLRVHPLEVELLLVLAVVAVQQRLTLK